MIEERSLFSERFLLAIAASMTGKTVHSTVVTGESCNPSAAAVFLDEAVASVDSWSISTDLLMQTRAQNGIPPDAIYFISNFLLLKSKLYWSQLSHTERESIKQSWLEILWSGSIDNSATTDVLVRALTSLAFRIPEGPHSLASLALTTLQAIIGNGQGSLYHGFVCLDILIALPEVNATIDVSRQLRMEIESFLKEFAPVLYQFIIEHVIPSSSVPIVLKNHCFVCLQSFMKFVDSPVKRVAVLQCVSSTLSQFSINGDMGCGDCYAGVRASSANRCAVYKFFAAIVDSVDVTSVDPTSLEAKALSTAFTSLVERMRSDITSNGYAVLDATAVASLMDTVVSSAIVQLQHIHDCQYPSNLLHYETANTFAMVILHFYRSLPRKTALLLMDLWISLNDVQTARRSPYLQLQVFVEVLQSTIVLSKVSCCQKCSAEEMEDLLEFRDAEVGIVDVLRVCFFALEKQSYLSIIVAFYQSQQHYSAADGQFWDLLELMLYHTQVYLQLLDEDDDYDSHSCCYPQLVDFLSGLIQGITSDQHIALVGSLPLLQLTAATFFQKVCRLVNLTHSKSVLREFGSSPGAKLHSLLPGIMELLLLVIQSPHADVALKSITAIVVNWLPPYLNHVESAAAADFLSRISSFTLSLAVLGHLDREQRDKLCDALFKLLFRLKDSVNAASTLPLCVVQAESFVSSTLNTIQSSLQTASQCSLSREDVLMVTDNAILLRHVVRCYDETVLLAGRDSAASPQIEAQLLNSALNAMGVLPKLAGFSNSRQLVQCYVDLCRLCFSSSVPLGDRYLCQCVNMSEFFHFLWASLQSMSHCDIVFSALTAVTDNIVASAHLTIEITRQLSLPALPAVPSMDAFQLVLHIYCQSISILQQQSTEIAEQDADSLEQMYSFFRSVLVSFRNLLLQSDHCSGAIQLVTSTDLSLGSIFGWTAVVINEYPHEDKLLKACLSFLDIALDEHVPNFRFSQSVPCQQIQELLAVIILGCLLQAQFGEGDEDSQLLETDSTKHNLAVEVLKLICFQYITDPASFQVIQTTIADSLNKIVLLVNRNSSNAITAYLLELIDKSRNSAQMNRKLKNFCQDLFRVCHRLIDFEQLQDHLI